MTCLRPCMAAYERDDSQKLSDHVAKQPAAPTKRTLEGSRGSCPPPWSPCSVPRNRSVRRGLLCGRSYPEAPPVRRTRLSPSPPSGRDPLSLRRLGDLSHRAPLEALCHCSAPTLLPCLQRFLGAFIVARTGREHASCPPSAPADLEGGVVQPYAEEPVEALLYRGGDQVLGGGVDGHVRHPRLALTHLVASDTLAHASVEEVADDPGLVLTSQPDERPSGLERRVGVVHDHAAARGECGTEEVLLPPVLVAVIREEVLAHVLVALREPLAKEGALPRRLQAHEYANSTKGHRADYPNGWSNSLGHLRRMSRICSLLTGRSEAANTARTWASFSRSASSCSPTRSRVPSRCIRRPP